MLRFIPKARSVLAANQTRVSSRLSSSFGDVKVDVDSSTGIATIQLCKAPVNTMNTAFLRSCTEAIKFVEKEGDVRAALVKSKFDGKVFSAGLDMDEFYKKPASHINDFWIAFQDYYLSWYGCKKPIAAAINGHSPAGGCVLALMCDYRVMQGGAGKVIGMNETRLGITPTFFLIELLVSVIGYRAAEAALLSGTLYSAEEAKSIGLVDDVDKLENLTSVATKQLIKLTTVPSAAYIGTKMQLRKKTINRLIEIKQENREEFVSDALRPDVQATLESYFKSLKAKKN